MGHGLLKKFFPLIIGGVLRTAGSYFIGTLQTRLLGKRLQHILCLVFIVFFGGGGGGGVVYGYYIYIYIVPLLCAGEPKDMLRGAGGAQ